MSPNSRKVSTESFNSPDRSEMDVKWLGVNRSIQVRAVFVQMLNGRFRVSCHVSCHGHDLIDCALLPRRNYRLNRLQAIQPVANRIDMLTR